MSGLVTVTLVLTIVVDDDVDRASKTEELQELVGGPAWVLTVEEREG